MGLLTVAVGGQSIGNPPIGPGSPGYEPVHNLIRGLYINMKAMEWTNEMLYHRPIGHLPNYAPAGLQFVAERIPAQTKTKPVPPASPDFGRLWAGAGG